MRAIVKGRWFVLLAWIAVTAVLFLSAPNMAKLVADKGDLVVPEGYSSSLAAEILNEIQDGNESTVALVFHGEEKLTKSELAEAKEAITLLEKNKDELGITEILSHFNEESLKDTLVSEDGTTILTRLTVDMGDREDKEVSQALYETLEDVELEHYYTSNWLVNEDLNTNAQEGLKKTEGITVVFILIVLLLVFRSVVAPFVPLVTVGFTYLASQSIVAFLVDKINFPISSYTQIFLVAVLFGIGTDYSILLLSRFKEEMSNHESITDAIVETYRTAGKTVYFSGLAVMVGFAAIGFSTFKLYQSAAAVAVGVALLMVALSTIVPFFMAVLGRKLFWPAKGQLEHKDSKLWEIVGKFALAKPVVSLLIVAAVTVPFLVTYDGTLSYNSLTEVGDKANSIKAFNMIADGFGEGQAMPTQIVIKNDEKMDSSEYIGLAEKISQDLQKIDGVDTIRSVTRPMGEPLTDLFVAKQANTLQDGIAKGNDGIKQIKDGLSEAETELTKSQPQLEEATTGIGELVNGTSKLADGVGQLQTGLTQIEDGMKKGSMGSAEIKQNLQLIKTKAEELASGSEQLLAGYQDAGSGLSFFLSQYQKIETSLQDISGKLNASNELFAKLEKSHPELNAEEKDYQTLKGNILYSQAVTTELLKGINELNTNFAGAIKGIQTANDKLALVVSGQKQLNEGMAQLIIGIGQLQTGLDAAANGQGQVIGNLSQFSNGLTTLNGGQQQLLDGFSGLGGQMTQLTDGLGQGVTGLTEIHDGLASANDYLTDLAKSDQAVTGMYIPDEVLTSKDFAQVLDTYLSADRKVMTIDVVFNYNPYSNEAMAQVDDIKETVEKATKGTKLENAKVAVGGITSTNTDLSAMSDADYSRTVVFMMIGISIILIIMLRSFIMPLYLIASLIITYYTSMGITEAIYVNLLGYEGISWAVPFFAFVILVALGIDYSIFLMDRFKEYHELSVVEAMLLSMKKMGTVIISAAVILGGTFAAMMPAGVMSLLQIATIVLIGLFLYALIILPLFVPVMAKLFGKANWWPFLKGKY
ncbi:MMPL family transporter [Bacillus marasmi]|uniref:MMPL family transporter n=1 Tax=Bacillus marasmi TaxID=1926279 RepID=UPI0011CBBC27|nr:MMPL family transporter [Bacillus marasmi]